MLLQNRSAIVSGIGPGLGRDIALALAREGACVTLVARSAESLAQVAAEIRDTGGSALEITADITREGDCARVVAAALEQFGGLDVLVNNAFVLGPLGPFDAADLESAWRQPFEVNLFGSLRLTRHATTALRAAGSGSVVMINTVSARKIMPGFTAYAASKSALHTAARYLAEELGPDGIRVNTVTPGYIMGDALMGFFAEEGRRQGVSADAVRTGIEATLPLRHIPQASEIADAVVFFASPLSRAVTGAQLDVNCGEYIAP